MNTPRSWRALAVELGNVAGELVDVAAAVAACNTEPGTDPDDTTVLVHVPRVALGMLGNNATAVAGVLLELRAAVHDAEVDALFNPEET
jgi:hypothetical protein